MRPYSGSRRVVPPDGKPCFPGITLRFVLDVAARLPRQTMRKMAQPQRVCVRTSLGPPRERAGMVARWFWPLRPVCRPARRAGN